MREHVAQSDLILVVGRKFRPEFCGRRAEIDSALVHQPQRTQGRQRLTDRKEIDERVARPGCRPRAVGPSAPEIDDRMAADSYRDRTARLATCLEIASKGLANGRKADIAMSIDRDRRCNAQLLAREYGRTEYRRAARRQDVYDVRVDSGNVMATEDSAVTSSRKAGSPTFGHRAAAWWREYRIRRQFRRGRQEMFYRHTVPVRIMHWINAICLVIMFMSGLQIFNAHPALYWGRYSDFDHPALWMFAETDARGHVHGITQIGTTRFDTTGILGASKADGQWVNRGFPEWATLP